VLDPKPIERPAHLGEPILVDRLACLWGPEVVAAAIGIGSALEGSVQLFGNEVEAQKHCPADTVVWVNTPSGIYHFKGMRWYGATNHGAYVCKKEGDQAGYRATRNGQ
jgi:hypothetical protein